MAGINEHLIKEIEQYRHPDFRGWHHHHHEHGSILVHDTEAIITFPASELDPEEFLASVHAMDHDELDSGPACRCVAVYFR